MVYIYPEKDTVYRNKTLYQWDYGQRLKICRVALPNSYEVHYATSHTGTAVSVMGDSTGAEIPDALLETGEDIHGWVYVDDENSGKTVYEFVLLITKRAKPSTPREPIIPAEGVEF